MTKESIEELWKKYNEYTVKIVDALGRTNNVVGEFAEHLAHQYYGGELKTASTSSYDIMGPNGVKYQVKSRRMNKIQSESLNVIRSWDFDILIVILFEKSGNILKALEVPVDVAQEYAVSNEHQNGSVVSTTKNFLNDDRMTEITDLLVKYL